MRLCETLAPLDNLCRTKQGMQAHAEAREGVDTALLPVDDTDGRAALQASLAHGSDGIGSRAARRDDVLDQDDELPRGVRALDPVGRTVGLRLAPHDQERQP